MIRTAEHADYKTIKKLIHDGEEEGTLAHRKKKEIKKSIKRRRTLVAEQEGEVVGTVSIDVHSRRLAEVRSLYVKPVARGNGVARELVEGVLTQPIKILPSATIFAISTTPSVFEKSGFASAQGKRTILHKSI